MVDITFHDSWDAAMEAERKAREAADKRVQPWQERCRAGDILVSDPGYGFPIFHELLDNEKIVKENLWKYGDDYEDEGFYTLDTYNESHMKNYRFTKSYSVACPFGELGDIHLSIAVGKLKYPDDLEKLKASGFKIEEPIDVTR